MPFKTSLIFVGDPGAYPRVDHLEVAPFGYGLLAIITLVCKGNTSLN
jgi:hypothetical protein